MDYWRGYMDWPVVKGWTCSTCGSNAGDLIWGIVHGVCRCDRCHTQYKMRDLESGEITDIPILLLKPEYIAPAKAAWEMYQKPISELTDTEWDNAFEKVREASNEP